VTKGLSQRSEGEQDSGESDWSWTSIFKGRVSCLKFRHLRVGLRNPVSIELLRGTLARHKVFGDSKI
jgi:hypothetical protein